MARPPTPVEGSSESAASHPSLLRDMVASLAALVGSFVLAMIGAATWKLVPGSGLLLFISLQLAYAGWQALKGRKRRAVIAAVLPLVAGVIILLNLRIA